MRKKRYPKYKPSGVEWLGAVPVHWGIKRLKNAFNIFNGSTPNSSEEEYWDGDIIWYTPEDLGNNLGKIISDSRRKITIEGYKVIAAKIVPPKSIIISTRAPIGHLSITSKASCTNQGCRSLVCKEGFSPDFYYYYLYISKYNLNAIGKGTTFVELGNQGLGSYSIVAPPISEQKTIATFLDREIGRIDFLIKKQRKLIELLKEKRSTLILQCVTIGLDPSVKLKPSGIEWLGDVPEHWKNLSLKWGSIRYSGGTPDKSIQDYWEDGTIPWLNSGAVNDGYITKPSNYITKEAFNNSSAKWIPKGSLVMALAGQGKTKGMVAQLGIKTTCNQSMAAIIPSKRINSRMLYWWLSNNYINIRNLAGGEARDGLNLVMIGSIPVPLPPLTEQQDIATFLDKETLKIDALVSKVETAIERLKEYRISLISSAVTGKIDVRGAV